MQTRGNIFILHYSKLHEFPQIRLCFSSRLQVSLPQRDVTSGSSFPLLVQPVAGIQSWCVGKEQIKEEEEEVWKRPHNLGGETRMPPLSLCKIAFSFISNCFFLQGEFSKRLSQEFTCVGMSLHRLTRAVQMFSRVDVREAAPNRFSWNKISEKTLRVVIQLQDTRWTNTAERRPLKSN